MVSLGSPQIYLGEINEESKHLSQVGTEIESSGSTDAWNSETYSNLEEGSGIEGSGFYSNKTGRWWWWNNDDEEEEEEEANDSTWTEWVISGVVSNTLELGAQVVSGAVSGVGNYISDGLFGDDDEQPTTQRPTTTEGSWLLGGFISNILNGRKFPNSHLNTTIENYPIRRNHNEASDNNYNNIHYDNDGIFMAWRHCVWNIW